MHRQIMSRKVQVVSASRFSQKKLMAKALLVRCVAARQVVEALVRFS